jgi:hypothetical protein
MSIKDTIRLGGPVVLRFSVNNTGNTTQRFCKWHTPFEPLMSDYLKIKDGQGTEVNYQGPMAKRIMPAPEESYIHLYPHDKLVSSVDLLKGYSITQPSTYTIIYTGEGISGLNVKDKVSFVLIP